MTRRERGPANIREKLREIARAELAAIERGDPDAPDMTAAEFAAGFERYANQWLTHTGRAHPAVPFALVPGINTRR